MLFLLSWMILGGCSELISKVTSLTGGVDSTLSAADGALKAGNLGEAATRYNEAATKAPTNVDAATGAAYTKMLAGDYAGADAALAATEATAAARLPEVKLRRAIVAVQSGDLDKAREPAVASGLPVGKLLAGEIDLANGNRDAAKELLTSVSGEAGVVGATAKQYLDLLNDPNPLVSGLSETQALWALGQEKVAVRSVEDLVKAYAEGHADGDEQVLLWAGRAAAVGESEVALSLLDAIAISPPGQAWRVQATRGIALCGAGKGAECSAIFEGLAATAPADGYLDAKVTAAMAISGKDPDTARALVAGLSGDGAARVLVALGDKAGAAAAATDPVLKAQAGG